MLTMTQRTWFMVTVSCSFTLLNQSSS